MTEILWGPMSVDEAKSAWASLSQTERAKELRKSGITVSSKGTLLSQGWIALPLVVRMALESGGWGKC